MMTHFYQNIFLTSTGISTDTRTITRGSIFIALTGEHFDGNQYIQQALDKGAAHAVSSDQKWINSPQVSVVSDTLLFLQQLATHHRKQLNIPIIALTGSNGKTTTKELILSVLKTTYNAQGTIGNLNNHIGVPLTLLRFDKDTEIGVVEMGANHMKEIEELAAIALPDYGLITNYGKAHLEGFGSEENIKIGKSELYEHLKKHHKTAIVGQWDKEQIKRSKGITSIPTVQADLLHTEPYISFNYKEMRCETNLIGHYNFNNILFAISLGQVFNIPYHKILKGIEDYTPQNNRSQVIKKGKLTIILDAYNANPSSMVAALLNLSKQADSPKTVILGDMFELGTYSASEHEKIAQLTQELQLDAHLIGSHFYTTQTQGTRLYKDYEEFKKAGAFLQELEGTLLIKGSRGMALERLLKLF